MDKLSDEDLVKRIAKGDRLASDAPWQGRTIAVMLRHTKAATSARPPVLVSA
jgi:hypothetical protein